MGQRRGGQGCSSILARKATNVLIPPRHRRASTRSMGEGLIALTHGWTRASRIICLFFLIGG